MRESLDSLTLCERHRILFFGTIDKDIDAPEFSTKIDGKGFI